MSKQKSKILSKEPLPSPEELAINRIIYQGAGDNSAEVEGIIAKPSNAKEQSLPLLIYNTPGTKFHNTGHATTNSTINGIIIPYAKNIGENGSIVVSSSLREADEYGGKDIQDVLDIMEIGKQQAQWDGKNVIMIGFSRGAMMTYLAIKEGAELTGAVIAAGETDLYLGEIEREQNDGNRGIIKQNDAMIPRLKGKIKNDRKEALKSRSAIFWSEKLIHIPLLILHGEDDKKVLLHHSLDMDKALTKAGETNHTLRIINEKCWIQEEESSPEILATCRHGVLTAKNDKGEYFIEKEVADWCNRIIGHVSLEDKTKSFAEIINQDKRNDKLKQSAR